MLAGMLHQNNRKHMALLDSGDSMHGYWHGDRNCWDLPDVGVCKFTTVFTDTILWVFIIYPRLGKGDRGSPLLSASRPSPGGWGGEDMLHTWGSQPQTLCSFKEECQAALQVAVTHSGFSHRSPRLTQGPLRRFYL